MAKVKRRTVYRSSVTGRFVSKKYAQAHKKTTEKQHPKVGRAKK